MPNFTSCAVVLYLWRHMKSVEDSGLVSPRLQRQIKMTISTGAPSLPPLILDENTWNAELCSLSWMWIGLDIVCTIISLLGQQFT
ncbi:hypothetical protein SRHO_G00103920 [Serrasalmus rhombeus]